MERIILVSLDLTGGNFHEGDVDFIEQLYDTGMPLETFTNPDKCVDFVTDTIDAQVFLVIRGSPRTLVVSILNGLLPVYSIYIFNVHGTHNGTTTRKEKKVKGIYRQVESMCKTLQQDIRRLLCLSAPISIVPDCSDLTSNQLSPSFMYSQLLKEIIVSIPYDAKKAQADFVRFCRAPSTCQEFQSGAVDSFEKDYQSDAAIWWYTKEPLLYSNVNRALRTQDAEAILKMGFFIQDLHSDIEQKYAQTAHPSKVTLYRGQALSQADFDRLKKSMGGLLSFNNFLSTSSDESVSEMLAESTLENPSLIGILYELDIDPSQSTTPFISLEGYSYYPDEKEILFSMHSVFRINGMHAIKDRLWRVQLTLTADDDPDLKRLTDFIRSEIVSGSEWCRLGLLMQKMGQFNKALELYGVLLETIADDGDDEEQRADLRSCIGHAIGMCHYSLGDYSGAASNCVKSLDFWQEHFPSNSVVIGAIYQSIGVSHQAKGDFPTALSNYEKALETYRHSLPPNQQALGTLHNNIALVQQCRGDYPLALTSHRKAVEIRQQTLPPNHPDLAVSYNNLGYLYHLKGEYLLALSHFEKALDTQKKSLPSNHPDLTGTLNNIRCCTPCTGQLFVGPLTLERIRSYRQRDVVR